jgi:hypothetical protein
LANSGDSVDARETNAPRGVREQARNVRLAARVWTLALYYTLFRPFILLLPSRAQPWCLRRVHKIRDVLLGTAELRPEDSPQTACAPAELPDDRCAELVTVIARGHSGTRAIAQTLYASGVYMGALVNDAGDLLPARNMYDACRILARHVVWKGGLEWDFSRLHTMPIPPEFQALVRSYLASVLSNKAAARGWKLPETALVYPWIVRMFPQARYILWIRDPRDCVLGEHLTDDLSDFGVPYPKTDDAILRRAISWKYQYDIVKATPRPSHWIEVRFEDFVLEQEKTLARLEEFLGMPLARIVVRPDAVGRWKRERCADSFDFLVPAMADCRYAAAEPA